MKFGTLIGVLTFCAGVAFTLVDIGSDIKLAHEYCNGQRHNVHKIFFYLTTVWILLGGLAQFCLVAFFLLRGDPRLIWLPKSIRTLLLLCSPILMAPVIVNVYGVILVTCHVDEDGRQDDILRFKT